MSKLTQYINKKVDLLLEEKKKEESKLHKEYKSELESMVKEIEKLDKMSWNNKFFKSLYILSTNEASGTQYSLVNLDNWIKLCTKLSESSDYKSFAKKVISICEDIKKGKYDDLGRPFDIPKNVEAGGEFKMTTVEGRYSVIHLLFYEFIKAYNKSHGVF